MILASASQGSQYVPKKAEMFPVSDLEVATEISTQREKAKEIRMCLERVFPSRPRSFLLFELGASGREFSGERAMSTQQPRALYLLFAVKMWECFSFYGMRALLVLYVIDQLGMDDMRAYGTYALYGALVEFGGLVGGFYADRIFGLRKSIVYGGWLIAAGHVCLSLHVHPGFFFSGLALIVVGSGLFSSNISALLGLFYDRGGSEA